MSNKLRPLPMGAVRGFQCGPDIFASVAAKYIWNCSSVKIWFNCEVQYRSRWALTIWHSKEFEGLLNPWQSGQLSGFIAHSAHCWLGNKKGGRRVGHLHFSRSKICRDCIRLSNPFYVSPHCINAAAQYAFTEFQSNANLNKALAGNAIWRTGWMLQSPTHLTCWNVWWCTSVSSIPLLLCRERPRGKKRAGILWIRSYRSRTKGSYTRFIRSTH